MQDVRLEGSYTFEFFSQNVDLLGWKISNLPILPEISLNRRRPQLRFRHMLTSLAQLYFGLAAAAGA